MMALASPTRPFRPGEEMVVGIPQRELGYLLFAFEVGSTGNLLLSTAELTLAGDRWAGNGGFGARREEGQRERDE